MGKEKPTLLVREIGDVYVRENFNRLMKFFQTQNQMQDYKFFEVTFAGAGSKTLLHGMGRSPYDIIRLSLTGPGAVTFKRGSFNSRSIEMSASDACSIRFFMGTYFNQTPLNNFDSADDEVWFNSVQAAQASSQSLGFRILKTSGAVISTDSVISIKPASSSTALTLVLPDATTSQGREVTISKQDDNFLQHIIKSIRSDQTVGDEAETALCTLGETIKVCSDGTNWLITARSIPSIYSAHTATLTGFGTVTVQDIWKEREGRFLKLLGTFTCETSTGVEARLSLPSTLVSRDDLPTLQVAGGGVFDAVGAQARYTLTEPSTSYLTFGLQDASFAGLAKVNGDDFLSSGDVFSFEARVPIQGWRG